MLKEKKRKPDTEREVRQRNEAETERPDLENMRRWETSYRRHRKKGRKVER